MACRCLALHGAGCCSTRKLGCCALQALEEVLPSVAFKKVHVPLLHFALIAKQSYCVENGLEGVMNSSLSAAGGRRWLHGAAARFRRPC
jgi:hypothetical protein